MTETASTRRAYRRAIVVIHGMGEQRPLDTLDRLAEAVLSEYAPDRREYFSRPTRIGDSYEARRYIIPGIYDDSADARPQTDLFEYHWSPLMTGNRLDDLVGTLRRILLQWPWRVPAGIRALWVVLWVLIVAVAVALWGRASDGGVSATDVVAVIAGTGLVGTVVSYVVTRVLPRTLTGSFVDVVRYLDPSPRSHGVRRDIRRGAVAMLRELNDEYDRVIVVAHSLGSYIAYDAIRQLWGERNRDHSTERPAGEEPFTPPGLDAAELASVPLRGRGDAPTQPAIDAYRSAQRQLLRGLRADGHTWRITDLVTLGSPMYFADQLYTRDRAAFDEKVARHEFPTCPPVDDHPSWQQRAGVEDPDAARARRWSYVRGGRRVLYDAAPFAVVRWTNMWFPARLYLFGDYFGGPLAPLFGRGVLDVPVTSGGLRRLVPGAAHSFYFEVIRDEPQAQLGRAFHEALRL